MRNPVRILLPMWKKNKTPAARVSRLIWKIGCPRSSQIWKYVPSWTDERRLTAELFGWYYFETEQNVWFNMELSSCWYWYKFTLRFIHKFLSRFYLNLCTLEFYVDAIFCCSLDISENILICIQNFQEYTNLLMSQSHTNFALFYVDFTVKPRKNWKKHDTELFYKHLLNSQPKS